MTTQNLHYNGNSVRVAKQHTTQSKTQHIQRPFAGLTHGAAALSRVPVTTAELGGQEGISWLLTKCSTVHPAIYDAVGAASCAYMCAGNAVTSANTACTPGCAFVVPVKGIQQLAGVPVESCHNKPGSHSICHKLGT